MMFDLRIEDVQEFSNKQFTTKLYLVTWRDWTQTILVRWSSRRLGQHDIFEPEVDDEDDEAMLIGDANWLETAIMHLNRGLRSDWRNAKAFRGKT